MTKIRCKDGKFHNEERDLDWYIDNVKVYTQHAQINDAIGKILQNDKHFDDGINTYDMSGEELLKVLKKRKERLTMIFSKKKNGVLLLDAPKNFNNQFLNYFTYNM